MYFLGILRLTIQNVPRWRLWFIEFPGLCLTWPATHILFLIISISVTFISQPIPTSMYARVHVCMCVHVRACMYACMHVHMSISRSVGHIVCIPDLPTNPPTGKIRNASRLNPRTTHSSNVKERVRLKTKNHDPLWDSSTVYIYIYIYIYIRRKYYISNH